MPLSRPIRTSPAEKDSASVMPAPAGSGGGKCPSQPMFSRKNITRQSLKEGFFIVFGAAIVIAYGVASLMLIGSVISGCLTFLREL